MRTNAQKVRLDASGPELECRWCNEYWPLTRDAWRVRRDGRVEADRCRSCEQERDRLRYAILRLDPEYVQGERRRSRRYRAAIHRLHPELADAYDREHANLDRADKAAIRRERAA